MRIARKVREKIKKKYLDKKENKECYIRGTTEDLEVHHLIPIASVVNEWAKQKGLPDNELLSIIEEELPELFDENNLVILCREEHKLLHDIFGRTYPKDKVPKVREWIEKRREKLYKKGV